MALVCGQLTALPRRAAASYALMDIVVSLVTAGLATVAREATHEALHVAAALVKACESEVEREKVCGEQLEAYALMFEGLAAGDAWLLDHTPIQPAFTLACATPANLPPLFVACSPSSELDGTVSIGLALRESVILPAPSGFGLIEFDAGVGADGSPRLNTVNFSCVNASSYIMTSAEESDVCVVVEGGVVESVRVLWRRAILLPPAAWRHSPCDSMRSVILFPAPLGQCRCGLALSVLLSFSLSLL